MIRFLPFLIEFALLIFCVLDVVLARDDEIRNLPKWGWIILIIFIPLVGCIAWLVAGRPWQSKPAPQVWAQGSGFPEYQRPGPSQAEIDERLNADLARVDQEHEEALRRWQADLERREQQLSSETETPRPKADGQPDEA